MVQTVSYSKLLTGLNFVDLLPICFKFDLIYTTKTTKIYAPRNTFMVIVFTLVEILHTQTISIVLHAILLI